MKTSEKTSWHPNFSHIYYEREALDYADTHRVLERFNNAESIEIKHYKDVFSRSRQDWRLQKKSHKLILAVRKNEFLYPGSDVTPNFGFERFYYNALILNCIFDCDYCYLQGMFPSANIVMFVNNEDYFQETERALADGPMYLALSYDTDLLAFEPILPYCGRWIEFAHKHPKLTLELRTKSSNYKHIARYQPSDNIVLAWTLSPDPIIKKFEKKTPSLKSRLRALKQALDDGWPVRLCFDPMLYVPGWRDFYTEMIDEVAATLDLSKVRDISLGVFRMSNDYLKNIRKQRSDTELILHPFCSDNGLSTYGDKEKQEMISVLTDRLSLHTDKNKIFTI